MYISTPCWLKHLCSIRALVPVSFFLSFFLLFLSISDYFLGAQRPAEFTFLPGVLRPSQEGALCLRPLERAPGAYVQQHELWEQGFIGLPCKPGDSSLSLSYFLTVNSGPPGSGPLKDQQVAPRNRDLVNVADSDVVTPRAYWGLQVLRHGSNGWKAPSLFYFTLSLI